MTARNHLPPEPVTPPRSKEPLIPPFTPRTPMKISRDIAEMGTEKPFSEIVLASGCSILVRGVGANKRNSDPVQIITDAITKIGKEDPDLANIPVTVKPFPNRGEWITSCYIALSPSISTKDAEPRTDLLSMWMSALSNYDAKWELAWTPAKSGSDKRMWIRFPDLTQSLVDQEKAKAKVVKWANDKGYLTCGAYSTEKGGVQINLASPHHADDLVSRGKLTIPGMDFPLRAVRIRQIEVQNALEMIITGVPTDYENMDRVLQKWLIEKFQADGQHTIADSRIPPNEPDCLVFHMLTWADTTKVLAKDAQEMFKADFAQYPSLSPPQMLVDVNTVGLFKAPGNIRKDIKQGATAIEGGIAELKRDLTRQMADVVRENQQQHLATQLQLTNINGSLNIVHRNVSSLEDRMIMTQRAVLAQAKEVGLSRNRSDNANDLLNMEMRLLLEQDPAKRQQYGEMMEKLRTQKAVIEADIKSSSREFLTIVEGPDLDLGQLEVTATIEPAPIDVTANHANTTDDVATTAIASTPEASIPEAPSAPPGLEGRPKSNRRQTSRSTTIAPEPALETPSAPPGLEGCLNSNLRRTSGAMTGSCEAQNEVMKRRRIESSPREDAMEIETPRETETQ